MSEIPPCSPWLLLSLPLFSMEPLLPPPGCVPSRPAPQAQGPALFPQHGRRSGMGATQQAHLTLSSPCCAPKCTGLGGFRAQPGSPLPSACTGSSGDRTKATFLSRCLGLYGFSPQTKQCGIILYFPPLHSFLSLLPLLLFFKEALLSHAYEGKAQPFLLHVEGMRALVRSP